MNLVSFKIFYEFLILSMFLHILNFKIYGFASLANSSDEIKSIFDSNYLNEKKNFSKDEIKKENFFEGGLIKENNVKKHSASKDNLKYDQSNGHALSELKNISSESLNYKSNNKPKLQKDVSNFEEQLTISKKLNDSGSSLFLGVPEVLHANGTSSIKPRKGVDFNQAVSFNEISNDVADYSFFSSNRSIIYITEKNCSVLSNYQNTSCYCCKTAETFSSFQKFLLNCKLCNITNGDSNNSDCFNIYCKNIKQSKKTKVFEDKPKIFKLNNNKTVTEQVINKTEIIETTMVKTTMFSENLNKSLIFKPDITKVPHDNDIINGLVSSSKKEILLPIAASILLLPLIGILLFFVWRKTKEYWDKRYYKRMDFLIDGMYND